ncbi:transglutaminase [Winogradskyella sp.]|jgi:hypothetical protein|uniref:transglutaminase n=1 Tax=Winogradskyella sp. TaxID=1883156 RepID=UPI0025D049AC|nr:transglutaminase [Winogradskyella sp.]MCT4631050.1 DUF3857 domain-containing protein [Winogradskyella sp.]
MKKIQILFLLIGFIQFSFAQEVKFGKVSKAELIEKFYDKDSSANAVILYRNQKTYIAISPASIDLITEVHERIKIYNKEAFDKATLLFTLSKDGNSKERVSKLKAYTFNLEGDKIKKVELEKDQIYKNEFSDYMDEFKFTMPEVKEGSVLDIKYKIISPFYFDVDEFRFQYDIPVRKLDAELRTPEGVNFNAISKGYLSFYPKRFSSRDASANIKVNVLSYSLEDIPALKEEIFVDNINNYRAGVVFELKSITMPGQRPIYYSKTWGDVAKIIGNTNDYINKLDKTKSFDDYLDALIVDDKDDINKMGTVFKYVKENVIWNGIDGKYFQKGIRRALKERKGNAADVNLTLVAMLRYVGLDANPLVISTRDNLVPFFPTLNRLNYVIAYVVINDKQYFLDATEEFSDINLLPIKDYNWKGILVDNNNMVWRNIRIKEPNMAVSQYIVNAKIDEEGVLEGDLKARYTNHSAYQFRKMYKDKNLEEFLIDKEEKLSNIEISDYKVENAETYKNYVSESFGFYKESFSDIVGDKMYIYPSVFFATLENPFKSEMREFPVDFGYPIKKIYMTNIEIPCTYMVISIPKPIILQLPNNLGEFKFSSKLIGNKITLAMSLEIKKPIIGSNMYPYLKEFFNQMINKQKEQVKLKKIE